MRYSFIGLFLFVTPVQAAEFKVIKNTKDQFIVKMTGRIVTDDIRKVRILLINNRNPSIPVRKKVRNKVLLLDSTGGGFLASHLIGVEVRNYGVTTVIPKGARCYSGCSMIFAAQL